MGAAEGDAQRRRPQVRIPPSPFLGAGKRMGELAAPLLDSVTAALEVRPVSESRSLGLAPGCSIAAVVVWRAQRSSDTAPVPSQGATALARKLPPPDREGVQPLAGPHKPAARPGAHALDGARRARQREPPCRETCTSGAAVKPSASAPTAFWRCGAPATCRPMGF